MSQAPAIWSWVPNFIVQVLFLFCHITKLLNDTIKKRKLEKGKSTSLVKVITLEFHSPAELHLKISQASKKNRKIFRELNYTGWLPKNWQDRLQLFYFLFFFISIFSSTILQNLESCLVTISEFRVHVLLKELWNWEKLYATEAERWKHLFSQKDLQNYLMESWTSCLIPALRNYRSITRSYCQLPVLCNPMEIMLI